MSRGKHARPSRTLRAVAAITAPAAAVTAAGIGLTVPASAPALAAPQPRPAAPATYGAPLAALQAAARQAAAHAAHAAREAAAARYTVAAGDTLSGIAAAHGTSWQRLWELNRAAIADPDLIYPGQVLELDGTPRYVARHANPATGTAPAVDTSSMSSFEQCVVGRESGGDPTIVNTSSGAGGLFQFLPSTWAALGLGYPGGAQTAPISVQEEGFARLYAEAGTSPWAPYDGC